jgi:hypothetical protein
MEYMRYLNDIPEQLMDAMTWRTDNIHVFATWLVAWLTGFLLYTHAGKVAKRQGVEPYPIWIHCYMISIDLIGTITFVKLAFAHDFFWFFVVQSIALPIWMVMEARFIYAGVKNRQARDMDWGTLAREQLSENKAWFYALGTFVVSFFVNMYALSMIGGMGNAAIWIIYPFTNYVYALWTWRFWDSRSAETGTRQYNSVGLQVVITAACTVPWLPGLSWYWAVSQYFHQPWYILGGLAVTCVSGYNLYRCIKLPRYEVSSETTSPTT